MKTVRPQPNGSWMDAGEARGLTLALVILGSLGTAGIMVLTYGNLFASTAFMLSLFVVTLTLYRIDWGFYIFVGTVLLFDQFHIPRFEPVTFKVGYFLNLKEIPYLPTLAAGVMNPLELHLLFLILVWIGLVMVRKEDVMLNRVPVWGVALLFFLALAGFFVRGMQTGGEFLPALWEVRALMYMGLMYFFVPQVIQTKEQLHGLMWVCIAAISIKAFQGIFRFARLGFSFQGIPTLTNHEDPLFMLTLIVFLFGLVLFDARSKQRFALILLLMPLILGFFVAQRRAAYAAIVPSFAVFVALIPNRQRWMLAKNAVPILVVFLLYIAIFWNSESRLASPVRLVKSGLSLDPEMAGERYYSNLYREFEKYNLAVTFQKSPVVGIGFGNKYDEPLKLADIMFPLRDYIPHNEVLWLIVKTGGAGFFLFWFFLNSYACQGASIFSRMQDPYLKAVCAVVLCAVAGQIVVSYFDLQLTYYRNMVYLGTLLGLLAPLESIDKNLSIGKQDSHGNNGGTKD